MPVPQSVVRALRRVARARPRVVTVAAAAAVGLVGAIVIATAASGEVATGTSAAAATGAPLPKPTSIPVAPKLKNGVTLSAEPDTSWWGTNGRVMDMTVMGNRVYIGGSFDYVGPTTGYAAITATSTGALRSGNPLFNGVVRAVLADGSGGWFVGGDFQRVGTTYQPSLAHISSAGALDDWKPVPKGGNVAALAMLGGNLLVGGTFTEIDGAASSGLALIDPMTGHRVPGWTAPAFNGAVRALAVSGSRVFVGGRFTTVAGYRAPRPRRAVRLDRRRRRRTFTGAVNGNVYALAADATSVQVFVGGNVHDRAHERRRRAALADRGIPGHRRLARLDVQPGRVLLRLRPRCRRRVRVCRRRSSPP